MIIIVKSFSLRRWRQVVIVAASVPWNDAIRMLSCISMLMWDATTFKAHTLINFHWLIVTFNAAHLGWDVHRHWLPNESTADNIWRCQHPNTLCRIHWITVVIFSFRLWVINLSFLNVLFVCVLPYFNLLNLLLPSLLTLYIYSRDSQWIWPEWEWVRLVCHHRFLRVSFFAFSVQLLLL